MHAMSGVERSTLEIKIPDRYKPCESLGLPNLTDSKMILLIEKSCTTWDALSVGFIPVSKPSRIFPSTVFHYQQFHIFKIVFNLQRVSRPVLQRLTLACVLLFVRGISVWLCCRDLIVNRFRWDILSNCAVD